MYRDDVVVKAQPSHQSRTACQNGPGTPNAWLNCHCQIG